MKLDPPPSAAHRTIAATFTATRAVCFCVIFLTVVNVMRFRAVDVVVIPGGTTTATTTDVRRVVDTNKSNQDTTERREEVDPASQLQLKENDETSPAPVSAQAQEENPVKNETMSASTKMVEPLSIAAELMKETRNASKPVGEEKLKTTTSPVCTPPEGPEPPIYDLPPEKFLSLHLGKGGGGTVDFWMRSLWKILYDFCHFGPCHRQTNAADLVEVNIRDPIDRFVSNFYWRIQCTGGWERQKVNFETLPKEQWRKENVVLYLKYKQDASLHAEALCSGNTTIREEAHRDMRHHKHGRWSLTDWIPRHMMDNPNKTKALIPVVLEKGANFEKQIDASVRYVHKHGGFEFDNTTSFENREEWIRWHVCQKTKPPEQQVHTSGKHRGLSKLGEKCLAQYFADDYKLIQELLDKNYCKTEDCRIGLQQILDRRLPLLEDD